MRTWLYDRFISDAELQSMLGGVEAIKTRVLPRRSQTNTVDAQRPFLMYGLGNNTNEALSDSTANDVEAHRQFLQIWIHDEDSGSYSLVDDFIPVIKRILVGASSPENRIMTIAWLETSQEFHNETYNTLFRYLRFQAILGKTGA